MTITFPLDFPSSVGPSRVTLRPVDIAGRSLAIFTGQEQVHDWGQGYWQIDIEMPRIGDQARAAGFVAFLLKLRGIVGTFRMGDPSRATPRGAIGGTPVVDGAGQSGHMLQLRDCDPNVTGWLLEGDYIQIGDHLHCVLTDVDTDTDGKVTLDIWPRLRAVPNDGDPVIVTGARGLWRLAEPERQWEVSAPFEHSFSFSAREAF